MPRSPVGTTDDAALPRLDRGVRSGSTVTEARFVYEDQDAYEDFWS